MRLVPGDELRLRYSGDAAHPAWQSVGHVVWLFSRDTSICRLVDMCMYSVYCNGFCSAHNILFSIQIKLTAQEEVALELRASQVVIT